MSRGGHHARPLRLSGANAQELGDSSTQEWVAGTDWRTMMGARRGRGGGRGAAHGGPPPGRPIPTHISQQGTGAGSSTGSQKRGRSDDGQGTPSKRRGATAPAEPAQAATSPPAGTGEAPKKRNRNRNRKRKRAGDGTGQASLTEAVALGASESALEAIRSDRQGAARVQREQVLNPSLDEKTEKEIRKAVEEKNFEEMGLKLLEGVKQANMNAGKMGRLLSREQEQFQREVRDMISDIGRQSRKVVLEFVSKRLVPSGAYWDDVRLLDEVNKLLKAKHGIEIPYGDVGQIHFKGGASSGCIVVKFLRTMPSSAFGKLMNLRGQPGGWKGQKVDFELLIRQQLTTQDRSMFELLKWCKKHTHFMRDEAQKRGLNPIEVIPWGKLIVHVRSSGQSGAVVVVRSGLPDLTIAKMSDLRGLVRNEWIDAYVLDRSPCAWIEPPGRAEGQGEEEGMEVVREGDEDYDGPLMSSFVAACGAERERREARGSRSSQASTESPTTALARLTVEREESMDLTPSKPPSLSVSPSGGSTRGSEGSAGARSRGSDPGSRARSSGTRVLDDADDWYEEQMRPKDQDQEQLLRDVPAPPTPSPGDPPRPSVRHTRPILDMPNPTRTPPLPPAKKRDLSARNAPLLPPQRENEKEEKEEQTKKKHL